jgi:hypothetical protein
LKDVAKDRFGYMSLDDTMPGTFNQMQNVVLSLNTPGTGTIQIYRIGRTHSQAERLNVTGPINLDGISLTWAYVPVVNDPATGRRPWLSNLATENFLEIEILEVGTAADLRIQIACQKRGPGDPVI